MYLFEKNDRKHCVAQTVWVPALFNVAWATAARRALVPMPLPRRVNGASGRHYDHMYSVPRSDTPSGPVDLVTRLARARREFLAAARAGCATLAVAIPTQGRAGISPYTVDSVQAECAKLQVRRVGRTVVVACGPPLSCFATE